MTKVYAYLRVSTGTQDLEKNKNDILVLANNKKFGYVEFIEDVASGKTSWKKRKIAPLIYESKKDDVIIVPELSRLGRSMLEVMEILSICMEKGIKVYAVKNNWELDGSLQSRIMAMVLSMASEIERDLISSRTREAINARRRSGKPIGRPKGMGRSKLDPFEPEIRALLANGSTKKFIANRYSTTEANLHNWLKKKNIS